MLLKKSEDGELSITAVHQFTIATEVKDFTKVVLSQILNIGRKSNQFVKTYYHHKVHRFWKIRNITATLQKIDKYRKTNQSLKNHKAYESCFSRFVTFQITFYFLTPVEIDDN